MTAEIPLPARTDVSGLARRAVGAAAEAARRAGGVPATGAGAGAQPDATRIAVAYASERWLRVDGETPRAFAPLSGFFRTRDGWVRTHANYPHHRAALERALGLASDAEPDALRAALRARASADAVAAVAAAGGLCIEVRRERPATDAHWRARPLVEVTPIDVAPIDASARRSPGDPPPHDPAAPLRGIRVLDLTRVIAGPVATRTLALLGAQVLRIDPPQLPEIPAQHLDTGHGKRSALLDLRTPAGAKRWAELLREADVVALGYRAAGLAHLGLTPESLAAQRPGLVVVRLTAWGDPARRGFDSLVQAESGIAEIERSDLASPGVLPAQALDHSAGYLLAAGAIDALGRRAREGGSWRVETSLRRVAAELLGMPRTAEPEPAERVTDAAGHTQTFLVDGREVITAAPAVAYPGGPVRFAAPRPWGQDEPAWV